MGLLSFLFGCGSSTGPYHKKDGSWFWKDDQMSVGADKVLTRLSDEFATVNSSAFYRGDVIPGSDATTFVVVSEWLAKDKAHVYFCDTYRKDGEFWLVKRGRVRVLADADPATFHDLGQRYARDAARIWYDGARVDVRDPATFEVLEFNYTRDKTTGYYLRVPVAESDGATFASVADFYAKDAKHVWYSGDPAVGMPKMGVITNVLLRDALPASFASIYLHYAKDAAHVFYRDRMIAGADPATFQLLGNYAKDAAHAYFNGVALPGVDPATFQAFTIYAKDATHVVYADKPVREADAATFVSTSSEYSATTDARDARGAFFEGKRVKGK